MYNLIFILLAFAVVFSSCKKEDVQQENNEEEPTVNYPSVEARQMLISSNNEFGFDLLKTIHEEEETDKNVLISPMSISMSLGMTMNGAVGNTASEIRNTLGFGNMSQANINGTYRAILDDIPNMDPQVTVNISNSIWSNDQYNVLQSFTDTNKRYFDAEVSQLDFSDPNSKDIINQWVDDATEGKISKIIDQTRSDDLMFLINAVYFLADWKYEFDPQNTSTSNFNLINNTFVQTDMMFSSKIDFEFYTDNDVELISLPYGSSGQFQFTAIKPGANSDLNQLISIFNQNNWDQWIDQSMTGHDMHIRFPKFETDYKIKLNSILQTLGMQVPFSGSANFSKIVEDLGLAISRVDHKTYMKLDEQGTEAAAVTSTGVTVTSVPPTVSFDEPFLYVIHEKETGAILFIGKMMNPQQ